MRILLFVFIFIFSKNLNAQNISFSEYLSKAMSLDKPSETENYLDSIINLHSKTIPEDTIAFFEHKIGLKYFWQQNYRQAIQHTLNAVKKREKLININDKIKFDLAQSYNNLGGYYRELSRMTQNLTYTDSVLFYFHKVGKIGTHPDNFNYANAYREIGMEYGSRADYKRSLNAFNIGINHLQNLDTLSNYLTVDLAALFLEREEIYKEYNTNKSIEERLKSIFWATKNLEIQEEYPALAISYEKLALLYEKINKLDSTIISFKNTIYWNEELLKYEYDDRPEEWSRRLSFAWNNFGKFYLEHERYEEAKKCFDTSLKIKENRFGLNNHPDKATFYTNMGEVYHKQKNYKAAVSFYQQALNNYLLDFHIDELSAQPSEMHLKKCPDKVNLLYTLGKKAEVFANMDAATSKNKNAFNALQTLRTADRLIDIMRKDHSETQSKLFWREKTRNIYEQALSLAFKTNNTKEAFYFFEKSKSILLLDAMSAAGARELIPENLAQEEIRLLQATNIAREASTTDKTKHPEYVLMSDSLTQFQQNLANTYPRYYQMRYEVNVADLKENGDIYSFQNEKEYVHFFYGENHIYTMRFGAGKSNLKRIVRNAQTDALIQSYLQQFSSPNIIVNNPETYNKLASQVYELLLSPLFDNGKLPTELILLPDDFLNVLPFDALKQQTDAGYLLQQSNIRYAYSINVLKNQQSINNQKIKTLGMAPFANSNDSLALNYSGEELDKAKKNGQGLFAKGSEATKNFFLQNAANYQFLHLSTHAREKGQNGNPEIFFADEKLDLSALYSTEFNSNLVILSACETGLGEVKKGEGVLSLNRGFTYAGAKSIISSLWRVNEKSTGDILSQFYTKLNKETTKSKALHLAKKDYLENAEVLFQSPYYWAGLTYSGTDNTVILERNNAWMFLLFGGLGLLGLGLGFLFWLFYKNRKEKDVLPSPIPFLKQLSVEMQEANANFTDLTIDHICYRVETNERYLQLKERLSKHGKMLTEKPIGGRPIATFKLNKPYIFQNQKIYLLELPSPKEGRFYAEGWEHIEMVIKPNFQDFMAQYPHLDFNTKAITKKVNPEVRLTFPTGSVKFHHHPLDYVIKHLD